MLFVLSDTVYFITYCLLYQILFVLSDTCLFNNTLFVQSDMIPLIMLNVTVFISKYAFIAQLQTAFRVNSILIHNALLNIENVNNQSQAFGYGKSWENSVMQSCLIDWWGIAAQLAQSS